MQKTTFWDGSFWVVVLTAVLTGSVVVLQHFLPLESQMILDQEMFAWVWVIVSTAYAGLDRVAQFSKTAQLSFGEVAQGNKVKVRSVIFLSLFLLILSHVMAVCFNTMNLALEPFITSFGTSAASYVVGNKAIKTAGNIDGKHTEQ